MLRRISTSYTASLLGRVSTGLRVLPSESILKLPREEVLAWCVENGVFQIPTDELVAFLRNQIAGRKAIEIEAGHGALGKALDVPTTDYVGSAAQLWASITGQVVVKPPPHVQTFEPLAAVRHFEPEVVFGCFTTINIDLLKYPSVRTLILVGNDDLHHRWSHRVHHRGASWLISRAPNPAKNCIYIWEK